MYTRELARIKAVQHKWILNKHGSLKTTPNPLPFEYWFLETVREYEANGADTYLDHTKMQVQFTWPNSKREILNIDDLKTVYYTVYKPSFGENSKLPDFEIEVGISA